MSQRTLTIRGQDCLLFRDGRTFSNEEGSLRAASLPLPNPGTLAGFLRSRIGTLQRWSWTKEDSDRALQIPVQGPLLCFNNQVIYPKPEDLIYSDGWHRLVPDEKGAALCDSPDGMWPLKAEKTIGKPDGRFGYLTTSAMEAYLRNKLPESDHPMLEGPPTESRVHVAIEKSKGIAKDGALFSVEYRDFSEDWSLLATVDVPPSPVPHGGESEALRGTSLAGLAPFGGERRLAQICENNEDKERAWPECPDEIREALAETRYVRMVLATPALFTHGWKPGWTELGGVRLILKAAAVGRRIALSGWDFQKRDPKAVRWMVPAGSVFYFEVPDNNAPLLADQWLAPVSDDEQDGRDGYGLALWGVWNPS